MTNTAILTYTQAKIILKGDSPDYPLEQHLRDMDLIEDLTKLKIKYKET